MMSILRAKAPKNREKRLDSLSAHYGELRSLTREYDDGNVPQRIRTFAQGSPDDLLYALRLLSRIRDAVTIVHGPRGCAAAELLFARNGSDRWAVTNLDERDTIMGADAKLRTAVKALYRRHRPAAIFIVATPAVAINNDDIQSVVDDLSEELSTKVVPVYTSGFASKNAITGYDIAHHALVKYLIVGEAPERRDHVNLLSVAESDADRSEAERLLGELGLSVNTLPDSADPAGFARAASAFLSISLDPDATNYLGEALESTHQVPFLKTPRPIGIAATGAWLEAVGVAAGKEREAAELHVRQSALIAGVLEEAPLRGVRVYLSLPAATAFGVVNLVRELGGEVAGLTVEHLDRLHHTALGEVQRATLLSHIHVGHTQPFEEVNILKRLAPELYVGGANHLVHAARLGIPTLSLVNGPILGYRGAAAFARTAARALRNRSFVAALSAIGLPYQKQWYQRSPHWHIKQEVK